MICKSRNSFGGRLLAGSAVTALAMSSVPGLALPGEVASAAMAARIEKLDGLAARIVAPPRQVRTLLIEARPYLTQATQATGPAFEVLVSAALAGDRDLRVALISGAVPAATAAKPQAQGATAATGATGASTVTTIVGAVAGAGSGEVLVKEIVGDEYPPADFGSDACADLLAFWLNADPQHDAHESFRTNAG